MPQKRYRTVIMASIGVAIFAAGAAVAALPASAAEQDCVGKDTGYACVAVTPVGWGAQYDGWVSDKPGDGLRTMLDTIFYATGSTVGRATRVGTDYRQLNDGDAPESFQDSKDNLILPVTHIKLRLCSRELDEVPLCVETDFIKV
jgi:hypothetical protein